jgi:hypothetical protein
VRFEKNETRNGAFLFSGPEIPKKSTHPPPWACFFTFFFQVPLGESPTAARRPLQPAPAWCSKMADEDRKNVFF